MIVFLCGFQDYIDSMEGATLSGRRASARICDSGEKIVSVQPTVAKLVEKKLTEEPQVALA